MKTSASRLALLVLLSVLTVGWHFTVLASPCCIIVVPPPPPPPPQGHASISIGDLYARLAIEFALVSQMFDKSLKIQILEKPLRESLTTVTEMMGVLGVAPINLVAGYRAKGAEIEIIAAPVNRPYFTFYSAPGGLERIKDLRKGGKVAVGSLGGLDQLYSVEALRANGINIRDVSFVALQPPQRLAALDKKEVDVAVLPLGYEWIPSFKANRVSFSAPATMALWVLYSSSKTVGSESKDISRFIAGLNRATQALKEQPELARRVFEGRLKMIDSRTRDDVVRNLRTILADKVDPNPTDVKTSVDAMRAIGLVKGEFQLLSPHR